MTESTSEKALLTEAEFAELCRGPSFKTSKARSLDFAKLLWVEGLTPLDAGKQLAMSRQSAHALAKRLNAVRAGVPEDWVRLDLYVPPALAVEVKERVKKITK